MPRIQNNLAFRIPEVRNGYGIRLNLSKFYDSQNIRVQNIVSGPSHDTLPELSYCFDRKSRRIYNTCERLAWTYDPRDNRVHAACRSSGRRP